MKQSALDKDLPDSRTSGEYHGWTTPASFGDTESEFRAARTGIAIADHSMFGRIEVAGSDRIDLLHRLSTNSLSGLSAGGVVPTVFVTDKARVIDAVIVSAREDSLVLITSPGAEPFLTQWIDKYTITEDIRFHVVTDDTVMISLIGAQTVSMVSAALGMPLAENTACALTLEDAPVYVVHRRDRRADIAYLITENANAEKLARAISALAEKSGARWIGSEAYEGFRIGAGIPSSPGEINAGYNPLECGLRDSVSFTKGCYIGQEVIARLDTYGKVRRRLAGLSCDRSPAGTLPRALTKDGVEAGEITSVTGVPFGGKYLALAVIRHDAAAPGDALEVAGTGMTCVATDTVPTA